MADTGETRLQECLVFDQSNKFAGKLCVKMANLRKKPHLKMPLGMLLDDLLNRNKIPGDRK